MQMGIARGSIVTMMATVGSGANNVGHGREMKAREREEGERENHKWYTNNQMTI